MSAAHTPGPWAQDAGHVWQDAEGSKAIANLCSPKSREGCANARLIAAAPQLVEALRGAIADMAAHGMHNAAYSAALRAAGVQP